MGTDNVSKTEYTIVDINDGFLSLMDESGEMKEDLKLIEDEVNQQIKAAFEEGKELVVSVQKAMGKEQAISFKEASPK